MGDVIADKILLLLVNARSIAEVNRRDRFRKILSNAIKNIENAVKTQERIKNKNRQGG